MQWYGNIINRLEENKYVDKIASGMDITKYYWSDRDCYYVDKVINQKDILVKKYYVCADHSKELGMGHQEWLYFKHLADMNKYLNSVFPNLNHDENAEDAEPEEWVYRYNKWYVKHTYDEEELNKPSTIDGMTLKEVMFIEDKEKKKLEKDGKFYRYYKIDEGISFGRRDYYYDWSF